MIGFVIFVSMFPLFVWIAKIDDLAALTNVRPLWYVVGAIVGWPAGIGNFALICRLLPLAIRRLVPSEEWPFLLMIVGGIVFGACGVGLSCLVLRARTSGDPDYESLDEELKPADPPEEAG